MTQNSDLTDNKKKNKTNYYIWLTMIFSICNFYLISYDMDKLLVICVVIVGVALSILTIYIPDFADYLENKFGDKNDAK